MTETAEYHEQEAERLLCRLEEGQVDLSKTDWRWLMAELTDRASAHATLAQSLRMRDLTHTIQGALL